MLRDPAAFTGDAEQTKLGAALIPVGDLLDACEFELVWQRGLVGGWRGTGKDLAAGVGDSAELAGDADGFWQFDHWVPW